jgi:Ca-activated chloride channel family protein
MKRLAFIGFILLFGFNLSNAQSRRVSVYSESSAATDKKNFKNQTETIELINSPSEKKQADESDVIRVDTDLVVIPTQVYSRDGKILPGLKREEFKIFEDGAEQELAYFSSDEQPFTVALVLDMSYSSIFKLEEIQQAAFTFINQLREKDKVMIISFDEKARVLCEPTNNRKVLRLAVEATKIQSGTSVYMALDLALNQKLDRIGGRKAVVLLSDGVDTSNGNLTAEDILKNIGDTDVLIYPIQYDTYDDVQKTRKETAQVFYDENDRPVVVEMPKKKGEREEDYKTANNFLNELANLTGGRVDKVSSTTNLNQAFARIADELRKIYSLGFYPSDKRKIGVRYRLKVRVYRPNLLVRARNSYIRK